MKIKIFKNLECENNPSMHIYAKELLGNMPPNVEGFAIRGENFPVFKHYISKEIIYPKTASKNQGDVNHIADHSYCGLLKGLDAAKTVVTCHDLIPIIYPRGVSAIGRMRYWHNVKLLPSAKRIITASEFTKQTVIKIFGKGQKNKITVIPYGISSDFRPLENKEALRRKYNISEKSILHIGSSYHRKNIELILEILPEKKDWQFVKIGPFNKKQASYIKNNNLAGQIRHFPFIDLADTRKIVEIYNCAGSLAYPSFCEGFGLPIIEALSCGLPVACSDIPPFKEIAKDSAVFFDPKNKEALIAAIENCFNDQSAREKLIQNGLSAAAKYTWKKCAESTYKVYEELYKEDQRGA
ncbi:MAG: glycosyltransferase family 4 protein [Candidatus Omnitrophica bacterium]|nr:glycosyltransferase family 4 protein [Candidatus Omnitrophota bacterium]